MADQDWQEAGNSGDSITWDKEGTLIGTYKRMKTDVGANGSNLYELQVEDETYAVWGSAVLDNKFEQIPVGSMVKIESLGKQLNPKTNREYNDFKVLFKPVPQSVAETFPGSEVQS